MVCICVGTVALTNLWAGIEFTTILCIVCLETRKIGVHAPSDTPTIVTKSNIKMPVLGVHFLTVGSRIKTSSAGETMMAAERHSASFIHIDGMHI